MASKPLQPAPEPPKPLRVALSGSYAPLHFPRAGQMEGLEAELARRVGQELRRPVEFVDPRSFSLDTLTAVAQGKVDLGLNSISPTESRRQLVDFTQPYVRLSYRLAGEYACAEVAPEDAEELRALQASIAVPRGPALEAARRALPQAMLVPVSSTKKAVAAVQEGQAECAFDEDVGLVLALEGTPLRLMGVEVGESPLAMAVPKGQAAHYDALLRRLEPELTRLVDRWQPGRMKVPLEWLEQPADLGVLCDIHQEEVELRRGPEWSAPVRASHPCGTVVEILSQSSERTPPPSEDTRYTAGAAEGFSAYWYEVRLASTGKGGWVYGGALFRWAEPEDLQVDMNTELIGRRLADKYFFGLALDQHSPSSEEDGPEVDEDLALPFLYVKGASSVLPLRMPRGDASSALLSESLEWVVLVLNSSGGAIHLDSATAKGSSGSGYELSLGARVHYQDGGAHVTFFGRFAEDSQDVALYTLLVED